MSATDHAPAHMAIALAHPARLRAWAARHGLGSPTLDERFRLLDLACGDGAHLLPLAARFPQARFVGTDRDVDALERARRAAERCGLANVTLVGESEVTAGGEEQYDFVIAHGTYSWALPEVQRALLATCRKALAPDGVALVSYNTYPGWAVRGVMREVMMRSAASFEREDRVVGARSAAARLARRLGDLDHPFRALLAAEIDLVQHKGDAELLADDLAEPNEPLYFHTFAARLADHDLQFLAELIPASPDGSLDADLVAGLLADGMTRLEAEQLLDVVCYRQLRASLLCRREAVLRPLPDDGPLLEAGYLAARLVPQAEEPLLGPGRPLSFAAPSGAVIEAERPLLKAALLVLSEGWPRGYSAQALISEAVGQLRVRDLASEQTVSEEEIQLVMSDLAVLCRRRQIELLGWRPQLLEEVPECPWVHPVTRAEAERSPWVTTVRHEAVQLDSFTRAVVRLLDGTRSFRVLAAAMAQRIDGGLVQLEGELPPGPRDEAVAPLVMQAVVTAGNLGLLAPHSTSLRG